MTRAYEKLDLTGHRCPIPVIKLESALRSMAPGKQTIVFVDDPVASVDIPHACREGGHLCERQADKGGICVFLVTRGPKIP